MDHKRLIELISKIFKEESVQQEEISQTLLVETSQQLNNKSKKFQKS